MGQLQPGDRYLLCSDGLYKELEDDIIANILAQRVSPEITCYQLLEASLAGACKDNVSVVIVDI